jgi:hypothetical protein
MLHCFVCGKDADFGVHLGDEKIDFGLCNEHVKMMFREDTVLVKATVDKLKKHHLVNNVGII